MTLYALLAVGTIFSSRPEHESEGEFFCNVAKYAAERCQGNFSLQLIHCRLLMTLYYFSVGEQQVSWDYGGMAIRAASGLKLNLESECQHIQAHEEFQYGLNRHSLAECRRRAFWSAYLTDVSHPMSSIKAVDFNRGKHIPICRNVGRGIIGKQVIDFLCTFADERIALLRVLFGTLMHAPEPRHISTSSL